MLLCTALSAQTEVAKEVLVLAQPNPVHEKLQLVVESDQPVTFTAVIRDLAGMPVFEVGRTSVGRDGSRQTFDFTELGSGIYICRIVFDNGQVKTIRLLKD